jgi:hypothetical protein
MASPTLLKNADTQMYCMTQKVILYAMAESHFYISSFCLLEESIFAVPIR